MNDNLLDDVHDKLTSEATQRQIALELISFIIPYAVAGVIADEEYPSHWVFGICVLVVFCSLTFYHIYHRYPDGGL